MFSEKSSGEIQVGKAEADLERDKLQALKEEWAAIEKVVQTYKEGIALSQQKQFGEAEAKYREVIREGSKIGDPMVLKLVSGAQTLLAGCEYRLWQSADQGESISRVKKTDEFGEKWKGALEQRREV